MRTLAIPMLLAASAAVLTCPLPCLAAGRAGSAAAIGDVAGAGAGTAAASPVRLVPRTVIGYHRGRKVAIDLVSLPRVDLELRTARAFLKMKAAAARQGIEILARSGFRSHEQQAWLYRRWKAGWGNLAAPPGYSAHQSGRAVDIDLGAPGVLAWLRKNARRFGFAQTVRSEPWHWEHVARPPRRKKRKKRRRPRAQVRADHAMVSAIFTHSSCLLRNSS